MNDAPSDHGLCIDSVIEDKNEIYTITAQYMPPMCINLSGPSLAGEDKTQISWVLISASEDIWGATALHRLVNIRVP